MSLLFSFQYLNQFQAISDKYSQKGTGGTISGTCFTNERGDVQRLIKGVWLGK